MRLKLFSTLLILIPLQIGRHFWPPSSFVSGLRIDYLSPTLYLTDILIILILTTWLKTVNIRLLLLFYLLFFAALPYIYESTTVYGAFKLLEFVLLGVYIIKSKINFSRLTFPLAVGLIYSSLIAIAQFIRQGSLGGIFWFLGERTFTSTTPGIAQIDIGGHLLLRPYATFPHPNVLGGFLSIILTLIFYQLLAKKNLFLTLAFMLGFIALFLTFSLSAYLSFFIGATLLFIKRKKRDHLTPKSLLFIFIIFITLLILTITKIKAAGFSSDTLFRWDLNLAALKMWLENPLLGVGWGGFIPHLSSLLDTSTKIYWWQPVHNIYLLLLSQTGVIGFSLFSIVLYTALKKASGLWKKNIILPLVFLSQLLFIGLLDHYFVTLQQGQILSTLIIALAFLPKNSYT